MERERELRRRSPLVAPHAAADVAKEVATLGPRCPTLWSRDAKGPAMQGLLMRRRGLEPPPGYPGPGPQPGASTNSAIGAGGRSIDLGRVPFASVLAPRYCDEHMFAS